jgi:hypothetical protein
MEKMRKRFKREVIDRATLEVLYVDKVMGVQAIADLYGKTRQRIWQLLKEYGIHQEVRTEKCLYCGVEFKVNRARIRNGGGKYCSDDHYFTHKREAGGYEPSRQGQRLSVKAIEDWLGFKLPVGFIVHHEDGNQGNTELTNLFVFPSNAEHLKYHHAKRNGNGVLPYRDISELPGKMDEWMRM